MADRKDNARTAEGAALVADGFEPVEVPPTQPRFLFIRCAECSAEVDRVEWDAAVSTPPAVLQTRAALGVDEKTARTMLEQHNPDALKLPEDNARDLAAQIAEQSVPDRDAETYACPRGHDAGLEVTER